MHFEKYFLKVKYSALRKNSTGRSELRLHVKNKFGNEEK
jgi:hypothetical protein